MYFLMVLSAQSGLGLSPANVEEAVDPAVWQKFQPELKPPSLLPYGDTQSREYTTFRDRLESDETGSGVLLDAVLGIPPQPAAATASGSPAWGAGAGATSFGGFAQPAGVRRRPPPPPGTSGGAAAPMGVPSPHAGDSDPWDFSGVLGVPGPSGALGGSGLKRSPLVPSRAQRPEAGAIPPLSYDVRLPPLHYKESAQLMYMAAGNGSLFAGPSRTGGIFQWAHPEGDLEKPVGAAPLAVG